MDDGVRCKSVLKATRREHDQQAATHWASVLEQLPRAKSRDVNAAIDSATIRPIPEGLAFLQQQQQQISDRSSELRNSVTPFPTTAEKSSNQTAREELGPHECRKPLLPSKAKLQRPVSAPVARRAPPSLEPFSEEGDSASYRFPTKLVSTTQLNQRCFRRPTTTSVQVAPPPLPKGRTPSPTKGSNNQQLSQAPDSVFTFDTLRSFHAPIYSSFAADGVFRPDVKPTPPQLRPQSAPSRRPPSADAPLTPAATGKRAAATTVSIYQCAAPNVTTPKFVTMDRAEGQRAAQKALTLTGLIPKPKPQPNAANLLLSAKRASSFRPMLKSLSSDVDDAATEVDSLQGSPVNASLATGRGDGSSGSRTPREGTASGGGAGAQSTRGSEVSRALAKPRKPTSLCVGQILSAYHAATSRSTLGGDTRSPRSLDSASAAAAAARTTNLPICSADMALEAAGYRL